MTAHEQQADDDHAAMREATLLLFADLDAASRPPGPDPSAEQEGQPAGAEAPNEDEAARQWVRALLGHEESESR